MSSRYVIGVDEAGRGALAGPVVAAAVILDPSVSTKGIDDSKVLSPQRRETMAEFIRSTAIAWSVAFIGVDRIEEVNILQATYDAMHAAINDICRKHESSVEQLLIDGNRFRTHRLPHTTIIGGDGIEPCIGAASILAKTARDEYMRTDAHVKYPVYGFDRHKGYGTAVHRAAIIEHGPCEIHRLSFLTKIGR